jgi:hypothetical protein
MSPMRATPRYVTVVDPATGLRRVQRAGAGLPGPDAPAAAGGARAWLFQATPRYFCLPQHLPTHDRGLWRLTRYFRQDRADRKYVVPGELVYLYQAGPDDPGLYGVGTIASPPLAAGPPAQDRPDWTAEGEALIARPARHVWVAYHVKLGSAFVPRDALRAHPDLRDLSIFTPGAAQGTNHALTDAQAEALAGVVRQALAGGR